MQIYPISIVFLLIPLTEYSESLKWSENIFLFQTISRYLVRSSDYGFDWSLLITFNMRKVKEVLIPESAALSFVKYSRRSDLQQNIFEETTKVSILINDLEWRYWHMSLTIIPIHWSKMLLSFARYSCRISLRSNNLIRICTFTQARVTSANNKPTNRHAKFPSSRYH